MRSVDLVVIGNLLLDCLPHGENIPGGAVLYTALAARCCGLTVGVHSVVGNDYPIDILEDAGVHLSLIRLSGPGGRTKISYTDHGRSLEHIGPSHAKLSPQTPHPFQAKIVHIAPMPTSIQAFHLGNCAKMSAFLDPYPLLDPATWPIFYPFCDRLLALLVNEEELAIELKLLGDDIWILLKQGEKGGIAFNPDSSWSAVPVRALDLTGAGDSFAGGLAAGLLEYGVKDKALARAARVASWALSGVGASGLLRRLKSAAADS